MMILSLVQAKGSPIVLSTFCLKSLAMLLQCANSSKHLSMGMGNNGLQQTTRILQDYTRLQGIDGATLVTR
ncbi:hypothetical protein FGO68_gene2228 [Halteria grandinella]|uniref:Uncharacterized protein n=1 Tax=Halteria grandinella TaxID=5974 RepID=A0A8J8SWS5_HALGN|nr:hypothetical protein FGO68_gene2228 [Halteria grandinella]